MHRRGQLAKTGGLTILASVLVKDERQMVCVTLSAVSPFPLSRSKRCVLPLGLPTASVMGAQRSGVDMLGAIAYPKSIGGRTFRPPVPLPAAAG
jgi:hypothetical protein